MSLHIYDCSYNNAYDRGDIVPFLDNYKKWGTPRILVPPPYHDEVQGLRLMLNLQANIHLVHWYHGMTCLDGWMVVIDPEKDMFVPSWNKLPRLEPRK